jgi:hypothetical protein
MNSIGDKPASVECSCALFPFVWTDDQEVSVRNKVRDHTECFRELPDSLVPRQPSQKNEHEGIARNAERVADLQSRVCVRAKLMGIDPGDRAIANDRDHTRIRDALALEERAL